MSKAFLRIAFIIICCCNIGLASSSNVKKEVVASQSRYAFLVGVEDYDEINTLNGPVKDICALREVLISAAGFHPENIVVLARTNSCKNTESFPPTRQEFVKRLQEFTSKIPKGSFFLLAFSGHGIVSNNESFLMLQDSSLNDERPTNAVKVKEFKDILENSQVQAEHILILLDACRNAVDEDTQNRPALETELIDSFQLESLGKQTQSVSILFSASLKEKSYIRSYEPISYFTWAVIKGLLGEAADEKGQVKIGNLAEYVKKEVPELVRYDIIKGIRQQNPSSRFYGVNAEDLVIAKIPLPNYRFTYTVEVVLKPTSSSGKFLSHQHTDYISQRLSKSIDDMFPLNVIEAKPALAPIKVRYSNADSKTISEMDYLVRMTFHFGKWHRSFILCPQIAQLQMRGVFYPDIKTFLSDDKQTLTVDALKAFASWGRALGDLMIDAEENPPKAESKTFTGCPDFVDTPNSPNRKPMQVMPE